jgi:hypothetical protein
MLFVAAQLIPAATHNNSTKPNLRMKSPRTAVALIIIARPAGKYHGIVTSREWRKPNVAAKFEQGRRTAMTPASKKSSMRDSAPRPAQHSL